MQAVVIEDKRLRLIERPTPVPRPHDVLVEVHAAGVNAADLLQRDGYYPAPLGWPADVPGLEMSGTVLRVGSSADGELVGRRVCAIVGGGAQATHCLVPAEHLLFVPDHEGWDQAGGFAEAYVTAYDALVIQAGTRSGDRVLISGAAGGVGNAAVQVAHACGAHVTAVTRSAHHHQRLRDLGADEAIVISEVTALEPVDVVLELVGDAHLASAQQVLAPRARVVIIGVSGGGGRVELDLLGLMTRRATLTGSTLRARSRQEKADVIARVNEFVLPRWSSSELRVPVARAFDFADVESAYAYFAQPGKFGKVIVRTAR